MFRYLAVFSILLAGSGAAFADAAQDCAGLSGDAAVQACDEAIRQNPDDASSYFARGFKREKGGDFDGALADFTKAIEIAPGSALAFANRGYVYRVQGDLGRSLADYSRAVDLEPRNAQYLYTRGLIYQIKGDFDGALMDYSRAIEINPTHAGAYNNRCWLRATASRDLTLALSDCESAVRLAPNDKDNFDSRGFLYLRLDRLDDAIADYDAALKIDAKQAASLYGRGLAKRRKGDEAGGDADIAAATAIDDSIAGEFASYGIN